MKKVGIIGCGKMGEAILSGLVRSRQLALEDIVIFNRNAERSRQLKELYGVQIASSMQELVECADAVIIGAKPQGYFEIVHQIQPWLAKNQIILSIAAGHTIQTLESWFDKPVKIVRLMPNTPAMVQQSMTAMMPNGQIHEDDLIFVKQICSCFGVCQVVPESWIDAIVAVSGSAPAYLLVLLEAMADGAVREGMPRELAYEFAAQTMLGTASLFLQSSMHPGQLKDAVCSPGGTTIEAIAVLEAEGFRGSVIKAMHACADKSRSMSKKTNEAE